jgi:ATP-dependent Clp protease ATP-binding subunit ClpA
MGRLPHTPPARKVIEYSIEEARNLKHNYVGTEHLLLGLLREQEGVAAQVLMNLGLKLNEAREEILNLVAPCNAPGRPPPPPTDPGPAPEPPTDPRARAIYDQIRKLEEQKEAFIMAQNFEEAARCRDEIQGLKQELARLLGQG